MRKGLNITLAISIFGLSACAYNIENSAEIAAKQATIPPTNLNIALENAETLDHEAMAKGIICSAHKYNMAISKDLTANLSALDKDGNLESEDKPDVRVIGTEARSTFNCIQTGYASGKCQADMDISGKIINKNGNAKPFKVTKSAALETSACAGSALKQASADAISEILDKVRTYQK